MSLTDLVNKMKDDMLGFVSMVDTNDNLGPEIRNKLIKISKTFRFKNFR